MSWSRAPGETVSYSSVSWGHQPTVVSRDIVPSSASSAPTRICISVDFPEPFSPTMPTTSPGYSSTSAPSSTSTVRPPGSQSGSGESYVFASPAARSTGSASVAPSSSVAVVMFGSFSVIVIK
jgi:hypothetical protein